MKAKFNKRVLALAVAGALVVPQLASAAKLEYPTTSPVQITYAKDLIVDNGITIYAPKGLVLRATSVDAARMLTIAGAEVVTAKITLTNGAKFDTSAIADTVVKGFMQGTETGGAPTALAAAVVPGSAYYSSGGSELNFKYTTTGAGKDIDTETDYVLQINGMQITNLVEGLRIGDSVSAEITLQNKSGQQILAASSVIAKSVWGEYAKVVSNPDSAKRIDVSGCQTTGRLTRFSPSGAVAASCAGGSATEVFNAGQVEVGITRAPLTDGVALVPGDGKFVNNFDANAAKPNYNLVATGRITVTVKGTDFSGFTNGRTWLDPSATCAHVDGTYIDGTVGPNDTAEYGADVTHPIYSGLTESPPQSPKNFNVCFSASGQNELVPQALSGSLKFDHRLPTQRVKEVPVSPLSPLTSLQLNGSTMIFQNVNPAGNPTAQSFLRLTNNNNAICPVAIDAKDDAGRYSGKVMFTMPPHQSYQFNIDMLETGVDPQGRITSGKLGDGIGKWYVRVTAECANLKGSALNRNAQTGTVTDLTPEKGEDKWLTPGTKINP